MSDLGNSNVMLEKFNESESRDKYLTRGVQLVDTNLKTNFADDERSSNEEEFS